MANRLINERFELLRRLSSSDLATEYYGWDCATRRPLLISETRRFTDSSTSEDQEYSLAALGAWAQLDHVNTHRLYQALLGQDGLAYLVCEYLSTLDLDTVLLRLADAGQRLSPPMALAIVQGILQALAGAHAIAYDDSGTQRTLTHGGIDGRAVRITSTGHVKVTGFGLRPKSPDCVAADVAATGMLFAKLLIHPTTFEGDPDRVPEPFRNIVRRMMRIGTASDANALANAVRQHPGSFTDDQATERLGRLFEAVQTTAEAEEDRHVQYLRGESSTQHRKISASEIHTRVTVQTPSVLTSGPTGIENEDGRMDTRPAPHPSRRWMTTPVVVVALLVLVVIGWQRGYLKSFVSTIVSPFRAASSPAGPELVTTPPGADVVLDGEFVGVTPYTLSDLPTGPVSLRLSYPGYRPIDTVFLVRDPKQIGTIEPFVFQKRIRFSSIPGGATVFVNGRELSDREAADYWLSAVDTVLVEYELQDQAPLEPAFITPMAGLIEPTDTTIWTWIPDKELHGGELLGQFERLIRVRSIPSGATVYLNRDTLAIGQTDLSFPAAFGRHRIRLEKKPFLDYSFEITVGRDSPSLYSVALQRTVHIRASDRSDPLRELPAQIEWIRHGDSYLKTPADEVSAPYSLILDGNVHEIHLSHPGYRDTTVTIRPHMQAVDVPMRADDRLGNGADFADDEDAQARGWVQFIVKGNDGPVAGAEVIGIEKESGVALRYGLTDADGEFITYVPVGDYEWRAAKPGFEGRGNGERVKAGRRIKTITLKLNDRGR